MVGKLDGGVRRRDAEEEGAFFSINLCYCFHALFVCLFLIWACIALGIKKGKKREQPRVGNSVEKLLLSYTTGGNTKIVTIFFGEKFGNICIKRFQNSNTTSRNLIWVLQISLAPQNKKSFKKIMAPPLCRLLCNCPKESSIHAVLPGCLRYNVKGKQENEQWR